MGEEVGATERCGLGHAIIDWNGTLLDDAHAVWKANNEVLAAFGGNRISLETLRQTWDIPLIDFYVRHGCDRNRIESDAKRLGSTFAKSYEPLAERARARLGAYQLLETLGKLGAMRVILSNYTTLGIEAQLERLGLRTDLVLANDGPDGPVVRRNKAEKLLCYLGNMTSGAGAVIIGDSPEEVEIGQRVGIWTIAVGGGLCSLRRLQAAQPDFLVRSLRQATTLISTTNLGRRDPSKSRSS
jgi:phosphoglycolate phosphatase